MNDSDQGIFAVEEGFSKELIERNKKRNGPIFGIEENEGIEYPNIVYDLNSKNYWMNNYPDLTKKAFAKLNLVKTNDEELEKYFDIEIQIAKQLDLEKHQIIDMHHRHKSCSFLKTLHLLSL